LGKETALSGLAVLAVVQVVESPASPGRLARTLRGLMPYLIVALAWGFVHRQLGGELRLAPWIDATTGRVHGWDAVAAVPRAALALLPGITHVPDRMAAPGAQNAGLGLAVGFAAWVIGGLLLGLAMRRRSELVAPLALVLFPLLLLAATAASTGYATIAERNLYLPSIGVGLALAWGLTRLAGDGRPAWRTVTAAVVGSLLVVVSTGESRAALRAWQDDRALYETMVRAEPRNVPAQIGLAHALLRAGDDASADEHLRIAQAIEPRNPAIPLTFAVTAARRNDWAGELAAARRALGFDSLRVDAAGHEASALIHLGRDAEAESLLDLRLSRGGGPPTLAALRGTALVHLARFDEARPLLESAAAVHPDDPGLLLMLGECYLQAGEIAAACVTYERATALAPGSYAGWLRLAEARGAAGDRAGVDAALAKAALLPEAVDGNVARARAALNARGARAIPARPAPGAPR
jgi:Flp pilus assembly protein TadD